MNDIVDSLRKRGTMLPFIILLILAVIFLLKMIAPYLIAITMGGIIALLIKPLDRLLRRKGLKPAWSAVVVTIIMLLGIALPIWACGAAAVRQAVKLAQVIADMDISADEIMQRVNALPFADVLIDDTSTLANQIKLWIREMTQWFTTQLVTFASSVPETVLQLFLLILTCYYGLLDGERFLAWLDARNPLEQEVRQKLRNSLRDTAISVVWASMAAAAAQALVMFIAYSVLRVPLGSLAAAVTFIFAWIPILGSTPVWLIASVYLVMTGSIPMAVAMIGFGVFTGVIDNIIRPVILKGRSEMHPLVSLVAIFGGIQMFGMVGVILGPIAAAFVITLLQIWPTVGRRAGLDMHAAIEKPTSSPGS